MDPVSIASGLVAARVAQTQLAVGAKLMRMNANAEASVAQLVDAASQNANRLADAAAGLGQNLDITA